LRKVTYRVRRGDTLHGVARKWKVDEKDIIVWNHLTAPTLFAGQRLELTVPAPKARAAKTGVARKSGASKPAIASSQRAPAKASPPKSAAKPAPRAAKPSPVRVSATR
jgi:LysM repeat protein